MSRARRIAVVPVAALVLGLASCAPMHARPDDSFRSPAPAAARAVLTPLPAPNDAPTITRVSLRVWNGRTFRIAWRSDGVAFFECHDTADSAPVRKVGLFVSADYSQRWERLARVIRQLGIEMLDSDDPNKTLDDEHLAIAITAGGKTKALNASRGTEPDMIWLVECAIEDSVRDMAWKPFEGTSYEWNSAAGWTPDER